MQVLLDHVVALALERKELEGDVDLALELLRQALELLVQVQAIRAKQVGKIDTRMGASSQFSVERAVQNGEMKLGSPTTGRLKY